MVTVVLTIINLLCFGGAWYFLGRYSIYAKLIKELREVLEVIGAQEIMIQAYKMMLTKDADGTLTYCYDCKTEEDFDDLINMEVK